MRITRATMRVLPLIQGFGLNEYVRGWNRCLSALFPHAAQLPGEVRIRHWGVTYLADLRNYIDWRVICHGSYECKDLGVLASLTGEGGICLDIGANIGHHSIFFGTLGWEVHAFEPNPGLWNYLEAKVRASGLRTISLHKVALGASDQIAAFEMEIAANSGTGRFVGSGSQSAGETDVGFLQIKNGDAYLSSLHIANVNVIKIDVQGMEPEVLRGLRETIRRSRPIICVEISSENIAKFASFEGLKQLLPRKYRFLRSVERTFGAVRWWSVREYSGEEFSRLSGNLFCVPTEHVRGRIKRPF